VHGSTRKRLALSVGCGVLRIRTAHSMRVLGAPSAGTTPSAVWTGGGVSGDGGVTVGAGGGSANSVPVRGCFSTNAIQQDNVNDAPSETGRSSTRRHWAPAEAAGVSIQTLSLPSEGSGTTSTA
jgi:hypothetical protein